MTSRSQMSFTRCSTPCLLKVITKRSLLAISIASQCINTLTFGISNAQRSTCTKADRALYVCPGFNQGILTFDDGSSVICGALSDSRYLQRLDPYGRKIWPQPVQVYYTRARIMTATLKV